MGNTNPSPNPNPKHKPNPNPNPNCEAEHGKPEVMTSKGESVGVTEFNAGGKATLNPNPKP